MSWLAEAAFDELWGELAKRVDRALLVYDRPADKAGEDVAHTVLWGGQAGSATAALGLAVSAQTVLTQNMHDAKCMTQEGPG